MRLVAATVALVLGLLGAVPVTAQPPANESVSDGTGPLDTTSDLDAGLRFEERILDHFHYGQVHEQHYRTPDRVAGDIATLVGENDSALYTGNYLGAQAFRYALARSELAKLPGSEQANSVRHRFWQAQLEGAKVRVDAMVEQFHLLINIAKNWQTQLDPQLTGDDPIADGFIDFGGGVFPGEPGLLFRACTPDDAPDPLDVGRNPERGRLVTLTWDDGKVYNCLGGTSRDAYAGTTFGLATALDLVGPDDPALAATVAADLMKMTDYALKYYWNQPRPHGEVVIPEVFGGNDLDNFFSPLFLYVPMARLNMLQVARRGASVAGTPEQQARYEALWIEELLASGPGLALSMEIDAAEPHAGYYKYHLHHLTGFNLIRLESDPALRELFAQAFGVMDATTGDDVNALFEAMTYALTGEASRRDDAVVHHRQWLDYRANNDASGNNVQNSVDCGTVFACAPEDQVDQVQPLPDGSEIVVTRPGTATRQRSVAPLPVARRRPADFMWQKDPTLLDENRGPTWESPAADFLLPYWMLRYYTEASPPPFAPFPAWPGPVFR